MDAVLAAVGLAIRGYWESPLSKEPWIESALDVRDRNERRLLRLDGMLSRYATRHSRQMAEAGLIPLAGLSIITFCIYLGAMGKSNQVVACLRSDLLVHVLLHEWKVL